MIAQIVAGLDATVQSLWQAFVNSQHPRDVAVRGNYLNDLHLTQQYLCTKSLEQDVCDFLTRAASIWRNDGCKNGDDVSNERNAVCEAFSQALSHADAHRFFCVGPHPNLGSSCGTVWVSFAIYGDVDDDGKVRPRNVSPEEGINVAPHTEPATVVVRRMMRHPKGPRQLLWFTCLQDIQNTLHDCIDNQSGIDEIRNQLGLNHFRQSHRVVVLTLDIANLNDFLFVPTCIDSRSYDRFRPVSEAWFAQEGCGRSLNLHTGTVEDGAKEVVVWVYPAGHPRTGGVLLQELVGLYERPDDQWVLLPINSDPPGCESKVS